MLDNEIIQNEVSAAILQTKAMEEVFSKYTDEKLAETYIFPAGTEAGIFTLEDIISDAIDDWILKSEVVREVFTGDIDADWDEGWTFDEYLLLLIKTAERLDAGWAAMGQT
jgi:hypothetical protein